ncbi:MAG: serine hydrolase, partial [Saprospiraceae bacterium]|nr:serine hydrolase [Saprospiraceae bacterium]
MRIFTFCLCVLVSSTIFAQPIGPAFKAGMDFVLAESEGMSSSRLDRIDNMLERSIEEDQIPGAVALVARNGKIVYYKSFGQADVTTSRDFKVKDIFRIASQTKAITSTAIMILWEEGHFQLDDPIEKFIPAFKNSQILDTLYEDGTYDTYPAKKKITIRHLLTHTSGIGYGVIDGDSRMTQIYKQAGITDLFTTKDITIEESILKLAKLPLHHEPGEKWTYSEGLDVLGYLVELISEKPFDQFLRERLFDPLGMDDTWFYLPIEKSNRLVPIQHFQDGKWEEFPVTFYDPDYPIKGAKRFFSGGAGLSSTAKDYARFLQMYLNKGTFNDKRILSRKTIEFVMANQVKGIDMWPGAYVGLAFGVVNEEGADLGGRGSEGTFDWGGYFNTQYFADPEENIIGILLKQTQNTANDETSWKFRQLVFQAVDDQQPIRTKTVPGSFFSIIVSDMEKSKNWYTDNLGFEILNETNLQDRRLS